MSSFSFIEFLDIPEEDILEWWTEHKLPHPGCPVSFRLVQELVKVVHLWDESRRRIALSVCLGEVKYHYVVRQDYAYFYFPYKDKTLSVPLDPKYLDVNWTLLAVIMGRHI